MKSGDVVQMINVEFSQFGNIGICLYYKVYDFQTTVGVNYSLLDPLFKLKNCTYSYPWYISDISRYFKTL